MGKTFERSAQIDVQMAIKFIKSCLKSVVLGKMQIKITGHLSNPTHVYITHLDYHWSKLQCK